MDITDLVTSWQKEFLLYKIISLHDVFLYEHNLQSDVFKSITVNSRNYTYYELKSPTGNMSNDGDFLTRIIEGVIVNDITQYMLKEANVIFKEMTNWNRKLVKRRVEISQINKLVNDGKVI